ncbi:acetyltransferase [Rhodanobacter thiooxydans]|uniref:Acetyltransferase n=1 Tax=Rhodanobacter thiooxydans TaxID=416169 RepID=A0A154QH86_9GAMM|nr:GNAT family N-acetyltransferase [Rhodanobacter thiooxydans]EIM01629.1 acetyltransferase, GNaT family protein [Rhodanobacter thiooxydans LCS2]KZC23614.1 acetyltransferase [Rhodanobacter thiooxydans]MCW0201722.1 GNAT family N-acetyltransferase [Rhodanobacter thiooxydans]
MSFVIRQATMLDLDTLAPLFDGYRQFYGQPADLARARDFLAERFHHHESLVLLALGEHGAGFGFTQLYPLFSSVRTVRTWLLNDLFVAATARRQGVGAALLKAAAEHAHALGAASLSLSTALDNAPAQALYESLGWQRDHQFCEYSLAL